MPDDYNLALEGMTWKFFLLPEIFDIKPTADSIDKINLAQGEGVYPYVTRSEQNNGINCFVCRQEGYRLNAGNCITVGSDTQTVFYQPSEFYTGNNIQILRCRELNKYNANFLLTCLKKTLSIYNYGQGATLTRLKRSRVKLPVNSDGLPDWEFMTEYMRQIEQKLLREEIAHVRAQIRGSESLTLDGRKWAAFYLRDILPNIQRGRRLKNDDNVPGDVPYVSSSAVNNGVDDFVGNNEGVRKFNDCITIANSGSVGKTFYHEYEFVASDHVTAMKAPYMNKYTYLFIVTVAQRLGEKYSFNREINEARINREKIMLPVDASGRPDWSFMTEYMIAIQQRLYLRYLEAKQ